MGSPVPPGPDWNAVNQNQRTAIALQQAAQVQQAQNALKMLYTNPQNYDPKTLQPTPEAMAGLMSTSPTAGMDLQNNLVALQQKRALSSFQQSEAAQGWRKQGLEVGKDGLDAYDAELKKGNSPEGALQAGQKIYSDGLNNLKSSGLPPELAAQASPTFDPIRARNAQFTAQQQAAMENLKKEGYQRSQQRTAEGRVQDVWQAPNKPTLDMGGNPIEATGIPGNQKEAAPEFEVPLANGKVVPVERTPGGGWVTADSARAPVADVSGIRKIGTKAEADAADAMKPTGPPELHGEEYLKALPASRAALIQGYADGRIPIPSSFALGKPAWEKVLADLTQYDPQFDAINYQSRYRTRQDFTSGKSAQNITSFNTAIGHLGTLQQAAEGLENSWSPMYNTVANLVESAKGDPRVVQFNTAKQAVADELTRAFRGTGGNVSDIKDWEKNLNDANSPTQLRAAVQQAVNLLGSRINAVGEQYRRGMGTTADVTDLLTPAAKKTLASLPNGQEILNETGMRPQGPKGEPAPAQPAAQAAPSPAAPEGTAPPTAIAQPKTPAEAQALPPGTHYRTPDGREMVR